MLNVGTKRKYETAVQNQTNPLMGVNIQKKNKSPPMEEKKLQASKKAWQSGFHADRLRCGVSENQYLECPLGWEMDIRSYWTKAKQHGQQNNPRRCRNLTIPAYLEYILHTD